MQVTVATYNIYNHEDFEERLPLILRTLEAAAADVVCLQEVPPSSSGAAEIASALGYPHVGEAVFVRPDDGWSEGLAILSRHPFVEGEPVDLRPGVANCFRARVSADGRHFDVYNTHLHPRDSAIRHGEAAALIERMSREPEMPAILCGDFNAVPGGTTMAAFWSHLRSAFELARGAHPETTFPTALRPLAGRQPGFSERREAPPTEDESQAKAAIDYVLVRAGQFRAIEARVIGADIDGRWPSDHYGVLVTLEPAD